MLRKGVVGGKVTGDHKEVILPDHNHDREIVTRKTDMNQTTISSCPALPYKLSKIPIYLFLLSFYHTQ